MAQASICITSFGTNACRQEAQAYHLSSSFQLWVPVPAGRWISTGLSANCEVLRGPAIRPSTIMFAVADCLILSTSGSGKSSLVRLMVRFWDPTSGCIRLFGQDSKAYMLHDLRDRIGVVSQDTYIFNDTVRNNLLLARPDASDSEIAQALAQAQLTDCIAQLPNGLETWVGEQGLRLSGGERQRLAIARALLKNAPLLILDEATANLDPLTERALLDTLDTLMQGRTTLMITHRLVAMERMDEILVLRAGQISESGTAAQLLAEHGLYRKMFDVQNGMLVLP